MGTVSIKLRLASLVVCAIITLDNCPVRASDDLNRVRKNNRTPQHHNHHTNHDNHDHSKHGEHTTDVIFIGKQFGEESGRKAEQLANSNVDDFIHNYEDHYDEDDAEQTIYDLNSLEMRLSSISNHTWMASFCSIGIISFVGLLTVGIIPMLKVRTLSAIGRRFHDPFSYWSGPAPGDRAAAAGLAGCGHAGGWRPHPPPAPRPQHRPRGHGRGVEGLHRHPYYYRLLRHGSCSWGSGSRSQSRPWPPPR